MTLLIIKTNLSCSVNSADWSSDATNYGARSKPDQLGL